MRPLPLAAMLALVAAPVVAQQPMQPTADFVTAAAQSDEYEIEAARVALTQSQDPQVRAFAQAMIDDHARTAQALRQATAASNLAPPPPGLSGDQQRMLGELQSLTPPEFDKAYWRQQALAHRQALVVEQGYAAAGPDANVRAAAQSALPVIQHHLDMAMRMAG